MQGNLDTLVQDFLLYLEAERGCSKLTVKAYCADLRDFLAHLATAGAPATPASVTVGAVRSWILAMHGRGLCGNSVARRLAALRSFWRYLRASGVVAEDVLVRIATPRRERPLPVYLGPEDLQRLLDAALRQRTAFCAFRDHAVLATFIYAGLRRGELLHLRTSDVDLEQGILRVVAGKGRKTRLVPMVRELQQALCDWLACRVRFDHEPMFITNRGNRIYATRLQIIWRRRS